MEIVMDGFKLSDNAKHKRNGITGRIKALCWWEGGYKSVTLEWVQTDGGLSERSFEPNELEKIT